MNPGLGLGALGAARGAFEFPAPGADVKTSSLALDRNGRPVQAYFNLGDSPAGGDSIVRAFRYTGAGSLSAASSWTKLKDIATGIEPVLSGGPAGLFMVDVDTPPGSDFPTLLDLRKVSFRFDGRVRSRRRHPLFSARFHVRVRPGSHHTLTAHILSTLHGLRVSHTLHNRFTAC